MKRLNLVLALALLAIAIVSVSEALAGGPRHFANRHNQYESNRRPWNGEYYHTATGYPVPLVVPPTARASTEWSWGVSQTTVTPIYHQFGRSYYGEVDGGASDLRPTPPWPSHTRQFGVYYIRAPW